MSRFPNICPSLVSVKEAVYRGVLLPRSAALTPEKRLLSSGRLGISASPNPTKALPA